MTKSTKLNAKQSDELLSGLQERFRKHPYRHRDIRWDDVANRLTNAPSKMYSLFEMERTGGEPDVIGKADNNGAFMFVDCAAESPAGRRSLCCDQQALESRKENKPVGSALQLAEAMGVTLLTEQQYRDLQAIEKVDCKTSSWIQTPEVIRSLGGALFGDRRYDTVFVYHNGASSYYAARGFRAFVLI